MDNLTEQLSRVPVFAKVPAATLDRMVRYCVSHTFEEGVEILTEGEPGDALYVIHDGSVEVLKGEHMVVVLGPGDSFGEMSLLDKSPCSACVVTREVSTMWRVSHNDFEAWLDGDPQQAVAILRGILQVLCERLRDTTEGVSLLLDHLEDEEQS